MERIPRRCPPGERTGIGRPRTAAAGRGHAPSRSAPGRIATQVKTPEMFEVENCQAAEELASVLHAIGEAGVAAEHVSTVRRDQERALWEITVEIDESAQAELLGRLNALPSARFIGWSDRLFDGYGLSVFEGKSGSPQSEAP